MIKNSQEYVCLKKRVKHRLLAVASRYTPVKYLIFDFIIPKKLTSNKKTLHKLIKYFAAYTIRDFFTDTHTLKMAGRGGNFVVLCVYHELIIVKM